MSIIKRSTLGARTGPGPTLDDGWNLDMINPNGLVEPVNLSVPHLPTGLKGLRIAHLSDLHIRRPRHRFRRLMALMNNIRVDLVMFTGDYINKEGDEAAGAAVMRELCEPLRARLGSFGVFGNHDTADLRRRLTDLPIHWLNNQSYQVENLPLQIFGFEADSTTNPDSVATLLDAHNNGSTRSASSPPERPKPLRLLLCHFPNYLPTAADLGADIMFTGHTHGGQCRLPGGHALVNSTDLPLRLTSGILRHRDTIAVVSRGIGEARLQIRLFCRPHLLVYTLHRGPLPGSGGDHIKNVLPW